MQGDDEPQELRTVADGGDTADASQEEGVQTPDSTDAADAAPTPDASATEVKTETTTTTSTVDGGAADQSDQTQQQ